MKILFNFIAAFLLCISLCGQTTSADFDSTYAVKLQNRLNSLANSNDMEGMTAAVLVPGQGIWVGTYGEADSNTPVTPDMRFGIASNSKAITAGLILKLQDEGLLDLDDAISDYLPTYEHVNGNITIRQLLSHTSGLFDFLNDWTATTQNEYSSDSDRNWTMEELINTIGPPSYSPGVRYSYSNTNFLLAGMIAEAVTGESIGSLLESRIFEPLDLNMAYPTAVNVFDEPYSNLWYNGAPNLVPGNEMTFLSFTSTAGAVWSTAYDMVRWYDALFGANFLSPESQKDLIDNDGAVAYGTGIRMQVRLNRSLYYHAGAWGFRSHMFHDPKSGISLCLLSNKWGEGITSIAQSLMLEALLKRPDVEYDVSLSNVESNASVCNSNSFLLNITNQGTTDINALSIKANVEGLGQDSIFMNLDIPLSAGATVEVDAVFDFTFEEGVKYKTDFELILANEDVYPDDNFGSTFTVHFAEEGLDLPYFEDFENDEQNSTITQQPGHVLDWNKTNLASSTGSTSLSRLNYFDASVGRLHTFELPMLHISDVFAELSFSYAYAPYSTDATEIFSASISTDCGENFEPLFEMTNDEFKTGNTTTDLFYPTPFQWEEKIVELYDYQNQDVIIRFEIENNFGNISYIDDIQIYELVTDIEELELASDIIVSPNPAIQAAKLEWDLNSQIDQIECYNSLGKRLKSYPIQNGQTELMLERNNLKNGMYFLKFKNKNLTMETRKLIFTD